MALCSALLLVSDGSLGAEDVIVGMGVFGSIHGTFGEVIDVPVLEWCVAVEPQRMRLLAVRVREIMVVISYIKRIQVWIMM